MPSSWKLVESASRSPNRSSAHSSTSYGSRPSNSTDSSPASRSSISSMLVTLPPPLSGCVPARARPAARARRLSCGRRNTRRLSPSARVRELAGDEAVHERRRAPRRHAPEQRTARSRRAARGRRAGRCRTPGRAARPRRARWCPGSRCRRPSAGRTRAGSRRGAAAAARRPRRSGLRAAPISASSCDLVSVTEKLQCGSRCRRSPLPRRPLMLEREARARRAPPTTASTSAAGTFASMQVLLPRDRSPPRRAARAGRRARRVCVAADQPEVDRASRC